MKHVFPSLSSNRFKNQNDNNKLEIKMTTRCEAERSFENNSQFSNSIKAPSKIFDNLMVILANYLENKRHLKRRKSALKELQTLSNDSLKDIGISRADAEWAYSQSVADTPSQELENFLQTKKACR